MDSPSIDTGAGELLIGMWSVRENIMVDNGKRAAPTRATAKSLFLTINVMTSAVKVPMAI